MKVNLSQQSEHLQGCVWSDILQLQLRDCSSDGHRERKQTSAWSGLWTVASQPFTFLQTLGPPLYQLVTLFSIKENKSFTSSVNILEKNVTVFAFGSSVPTISHPFVSSKLNTHTHTLTYSSHIHTHSLTHHTYTHTHTHSLTHHTYTHTHSLTHRTYTHTYISSPSPPTHTHTHTYTHTHSHARTYTHTNHLAHLFVMFYFAVYWAAVNVHIF